MSIINAYSLYHQVQQVKISQLEFRQQLLHQIITQYSQECSSTETPSSRLHHSQHKQHWPQHTNLEHDCAYCSIPSIQRKRSRTRCEQCHVYLCIDPCFELFHTAEQ
jgi:DDE family transposase